MSFGPMHHGNRSEWKRRLFTPRQTGSRVEEFIIWWTTNRTEQNSSQHCTPETEQHNNGRQDTMNPK